jgi:hypothetical protein
MIWNTSLMLDTRKSTEHPREPYTSFQNDLHLFYVDDAN